MHFHFNVSGTDMNTAGNASAEMKKQFRQMGIPPDIIKRAIIAMYEAEMNMAVHAGGGEADVDVTDSQIIIVMKDYGPGIPNLEQALQEGFSTATEEVNQLGFGAGMGLQNMKRNCDSMDIETAPKQGTVITMKIEIPAKLG